MSSWSNIFLARDNLYATAWAYFPAQQGPTQGLANLWSRNLYFHATHKWRQNFGSNLELAAKQVLRKKVETTKPLSLHDLTPPPSFEGSETKKICHLKL